MREEGFKNWEKKYKNTSSKELNDEFFIPAQQ